MEGRAARRGAALIIACVRCMMGMWSSSRSPASRCGLMLTCRGRVRVEAQATRGAASKV